MVSPHIKLALSTEFMCGSQPYCLLGGEKIFEAFYLSEIRGVHLYETKFILVS